MTALTTDQIEAVRAEARKNNTRDWAMLLVTFRHALRSGEVRALKVEDVSLSDEEITIRRLKGSRSGTHTLDRHHGKPLLDEVTALRAWLKERVEDGSRILFQSEKGGMLTRMQLLRIFRRYAEAAGVPADLCHPHVLRHSLCSTMAGEGANVSDIQARVGHRNLANTMLYVHINDQRASDACRESLMTAFG